MMAEKPAITPFSQEIAHNVAGRIAHFCGFILLCITEKKEKTGIR